MIIIRLAGGLGNQMFQYATAKSLAKKNATDLKLDLTYFEKRPAKRPYRLEVFELAATIATPAEIKKAVFGQPDNLRAKLKSIFFRRHFGPGYFHEKNPAFDPEILRLQGNIYLHGYWQSEKYFRDIRADLLHDFSLNTEHRSLPPDIHQDIISREAVSLHIRRGDYISDKKSYEYHGVCSLDYYRTAFKIMREKLGRGIKIFVFSDDIPWCRANLALETEICFVGGLEDYQDLCLMSLCRHNIIANSSFSWWGAWLNDNPEKIVIAPKAWTRTQTADVYVPEKWLKI